MGPPHQKVGEAAPPRPRPTTRACSVSRFRTMRSVNWLSQWHWHCIHYQSVASLAVCKTTVDERLDAVNERLELSAALGWRLYGDKTAIAKMHASHNNTQ